MSASDSFEDLGRLADELADASDPVVSGEENAQAAAVRLAAAALGEAVAFDPAEIEAVLDRDDEPPVPPPDLPDDYEVLEEIGRGGMGIVYRARQRSLDRTVAVKVLRPGDLLFGQAMKRFQREARALASLRHRHIVSIHEVGESEGRVWFSMDCIEGRSMAEHVREGRMTPSRVVKLMKQVTSAVSYVHSHGLVHRDLKPANILVDEHGDAVVTDFGLALEIGSADGLTMTGQILGTPAYMSPEQARGDTASIGEATDVYALGAVLYECLTGQRPFEGESPAMQVWSVLHKDPTRPRRIDKRVPEDLEIICLKAMRKRPEDRYPTARALLEDLERFEEGRAIRAQPPTKAYRFGRFVKRHRAPIAWASGVLAAAILVFTMLIAPRLLRNPDPLLEAADDLMTQRDPIGAARLYERALRMTGGTPERDLYAKLTRARLEAAEAMWAEDRVSEAVRLLERAWVEGRRHYGDRGWRDAGRVEWALATAYALDHYNLPIEDAGPKWRHHFPHALKIWNEELRRNPYGIHPTELEFRDPAARLVLERIVPLLVDQSRDPGGSAWVQLLAVSRHAQQSHEVLSAMLETDLVDPVPLIRPFAYAIGARPGRGVAESPDQYVHDISPSAPLGTHESDVFMDAVRRLESPKVATVLGRGIDNADADEAPFRYLLAALLADRLDLPVRIAFGPVDAQDLEVHVSTLREAAGAVRDLPRDEGLRWRVNRAFETWAQIEEEQASAQGVARQRAFQALRNLQMWLSHRTGQRGFQRRPALETWWAIHGDEDPRIWLATALGLGTDPKETRTVALLDRLRRTEGDEQAWAHFLLTLTVPEDVAVPVWGTRWVGKDILSQWRSRLDIAPAYTHARMATFVDGATGWQIVGSAVQEIPADLSVDLHYEAPAVSTPLPDIALSFPGLPMGEQAGMRGTMDVEGQLAWGAEGLEYQITSRRMQRSSSRTSSRGSSATMRATWVMSPDLNVGGWSDPDPFRHQLTLMALEADTDGSAALTVSDWQERRRLDLDDLATQAEDYVDPWPDGMGANQFLLKHQRVLSNVLGAAAWIPLPEGQEELRRIEAALLEDGHLDHQPQLALLARLMAGDESVLDHPDFETRLGAMLPHDIAFTTVGRDGEYWIRLLRLTSSAKIRALAIARLESSVISARAAGDLLEAWRGGSVSLPDTLAERLRVGPTQDRSWWGLVKADWGFSLAAGVLLLIGGLLFLRVVWAGLRADQRLVPAAWLVVVGLLTACTSIFMAGVDLLPAPLGYLWAALGFWILEKEAGDATDGRGAWLLLFAAAFSVRSVVGMAGEVELNLAALACFGAFIGLPKLIWALRGEDRGRRRWPWAFFLFYVLPIWIAYGLVIGMILVGWEANVSVDGFLGTILLIGWFVCVLWALLSLVGAAGVRKVWRRSRRVKAT